jgi:hypothetical protein
METNNKTYYKIVLKQLVILGVSINFILSSTLVWKNWLYVSHVEDFHKIGISVHSLRN